MRTLAPANNWDWNEVLLNKIAHWVEWLAWAKTKDAQKKTPQNQPQYFKPDFIRDEETKALNRDSETHTVEGVKAILALPRK